LLCNAKWAICQLYHDERLLCNAKWAICQLYHDEWLLFSAESNFHRCHGENKLHLNEMTMSALYWTTMLSCDFL
jgi:hypothetical protein